MGIKLKNSFSSKNIVFTSRPLQLIHLDCLVQPELHPQVERIMDLS